MLTAHSAAWLCAEVDANIFLCCFHLIVFERSTLGEPGVCHFSCTGRRASLQGSLIFTPLSSDPVQMYTAMAMLIFCVGTAHPKPGPSASTVSTLNTVHLPGPRIYLLFSFHPFGPCLIIPIQPFYRSVYYPWGSSTSP